MLHGRHPGFRDGYLGQKTPSPNPTTFSTCSTRHKWRSFIARDFRLSNWRCSYRFHFGSVSPTCRQSSLSTSGFGQSLAQDYTFRCLCWVWRQHGEPFLFLSLHFPPFPDDTSLNLDRLISGGNTPTDVVQQTDKASLVGSDTREG